MTRVYDSHSDPSSPQLPSHPSGGTKGDYSRQGPGRAVNQPHRASPELPQRSLNPNGTLAPLYAAVAHSKSDQKVEPGHPGPATSLLEPNTDSSGRSAAEPAAEPVQAVEPAEPDPGDQAAPASEQSLGFWPVLRNRNFLALWSGQVFSQLADKIYLVLMIALITSRYQAAGQTVSGWVSSIMIAFTIPAVLFGSVAGVFVDRWPKKQVLVVTNLLRGALVLLLPLLLSLAQDWGQIAGVPVSFYLLLVVTFLVSTLTQFFAPAEQAAMPLIVERQLLLPANSLYTLTMMAAVIVGFAVGEPLLALADSLVHQLGIHLEFGRELLVGASYAIAGLVLLLLRTGEQTEESGSSAPHVWQDIQDGLRYLQQHKRVRGALIQLVILFSVFAALAVLVVRMAEIIPGIKASQFGFLLAAGGIGMAASLAVLGPLRQRFSHHQLSFYGSMGMATALAALSLVSFQLWPVLILLASVGACAAIVGVPMQTQIQEETPEDLRGKVFGLQNNAVNIALSLPLALAGLAETFLGLQAVLMGLAVIVVTGGFLTWYIADTGSS